MDPGSTNLLKGEFERQELRHRMATLFAFVNEVRGLAPDGPRGLPALAALDQLLELPEERRLRALPRAFEEFAQACAAASTDSATVFEALNEFVFERYPELLAEQSFAALIEALRRRAGTMARLLRENVAHLEQARTKLGHRDAELERLHRNVRRLSTERRALADDLQRSRMLVDRGLGAAGIAHDTSNYLQAIVAHASLALDGRLDVRGARRRFEQVLGLSARAAQLMHGLADWNRAEPPARRPVDVNEAVREVLELVGAAAPARIRTTFAPGEALPRAHSHPVELRRVVLNLLFNAWQAIGSNEGAVGVTTGFESGGGDIQVWIEVCDDGPGVDDDMRARLFEPFHSTREQGNGIGLASVRMLLERSAGRLEVWSRPGEGARFRVSLPIAAGRSAT